MPEKQELDGFLLQNEAGQLGRLARFPQNWKWIRVEPSEMSAAQESVRFSLHCHVVQISLICFHSVYYYVS